MEINNIKDSILFFAEKYNKKLNYEYILKDNAVRPEHVNLIVIEMFLNKFNPIYCNEIESKHYQTIFDFLKKHSNN